MHSNDEIIFNLVKNHFSLDNKSLKRFENIIFNKEERLKYIPENVIPYLDENLRIRKELSFEEKSNLDTGWFKFKDFFHRFMETHPRVNYENFYYNKISVGKNDFKLFKYVKKWYIEKDCDEYTFELLSCSGIYLPSDEESSPIKYIEDAFKIITEDIGQHKLPDRNLEIVISYNYTDWFLSATAENWSSCLNLESSYEKCFWAGLPGIIIDKNRALMYVTDGRDKYYNFNDEISLSSERLINRSWLILTDEDMYLPIRFYPSNFLMGVNFNDYFPELDISNDELYYNHYTKYVSKYPLNLLFNKYGESVFIYIDKGNFATKNDELYITGDESGGVRTIILPLEGNIKNTRIYNSTKYEYTDGLSMLVSNSEEIFQYHLCHRFIEDYSEEKAFEILYDCADYEFIRDLDKEKPEMFSSFITDGIDYCNVQYSFSIINNINRQHC
jgi:hypothetical protein